MTEAMQPFDSTHIKARPEVLTWYQQVARNHAEHPDWTTAQHIAALNEGMYKGGDMATLAAVYGDTPEAMVAQALKEATENDHT